jgi:hypothetical protein
MRFFSIDVGDQLLSAWGQTAAQLIPEHVVTQRSARRSNRTERSSGCASGCACEAQSRAGWLA